MTAVRKLYVPPAPVKSESEPSEYVLKAIKDMDPNFLKCRDLSHQWNDYGPKWLPSFNHYEQVLKCTRCTLQKYRIISKTGHLIDSWYDRYPEGYLMPRGTGHLTVTVKDHIRLASIQLAVIREVPSE